MLQEPVTNSDTGSSSIYEELIKDQLAEERATKESLEHRGDFVITSSAALATLLFGLAALVTGAQSFSVTAEVRFFLIAAVVLFLSASALGLRVNRPTQYREASLEGLHTLVADSSAWKESAARASRSVSMNRLQILKAAREVNQTKANQLNTAFRLELGAVFLVAASVTAILIRG